MEKLRVFEAFSGYGSQSLSLELIGVPHEVVGISEINVNALKGYVGMRGLDINLYDVSNKSYEEMIKELEDAGVGYDMKKGRSTVRRLPKKKIVEIYKCHKLSKNYGDISKLSVEELPSIDYFTYSFPCTDISSAGVMKGLVRGGTRSGLLYECEKIIESKRPKYLLMENVKMLVSVKFKDKFEEWCKYLESLGYKNYWKVLNAKYFGVAQTRERVFMVSILDAEEGYEFPKENRDGLLPKLKDFLEKEVDYKYYLKEEQLKKFEITRKEYGKSLSVGTIPTQRGKIHQKGGVYDESNIIGVLCASDCKDMKKVLCLDETKEKWCKELKEVKCKLKLKGEDGVVEISDYVIFSFRYDEGVRLYKDNVAGVLTTKCYETYVTVEGVVRRLTTKECFRLMGVPDENIENLERSGLNLSDTVKYTLAGNSIVINVLNEIHKKLFLEEK